MDKKIPFYLLTGFLGSGKTTLLKKIIHQYADKKRLAVIQNDFAPANIDGKELRAMGKSFEILEINRGSVFCVCLIADFKKALYDLVETTKPDAVILEASGLSDPVAIAQLLEAPELEQLYLSHIWTIVDAANFEKAKSITRVSHQIRVADTVLINKTDLAAENIENVKGYIKTLNPFADILETQYCNIKSDLLPDDAKTPVALQRSKELEAFENSGRPDLGSAVVRTTKKISRDNLEKLLNEQQAVTYRLKGFINLTDETTVVVQSCFGKTDIIPVDNYSGPTEIIAMGPGVNAHQFSKYYRTLTEISPLNK